MKLCLRRLLCVLAAMATHASSMANQGSDIIIDSFEDSELHGWSVSSEAFASSPYFPAQKPGFINRGGHGIAWSGAGGKGLRGQLTSNEFIIQRRYISFLV